jgi:hypothetical protein
MADLFATGHIVYFILAFMLLEAVVSLALNRHWRLGTVPAAVIFNLGSGAALLMALRAALMQAAWPMIAAWLLVALAGHVGEVSVRWSAAKSETTR